MKNPKFNFIFLGQSILKYQVPLDIFTAINQIYEQNYHKLDKANQQLVGKIKNEHSLFYHGADETKMKNHNVLYFLVTYYGFSSLFDQPHYKTMNVPSQSYLLIVHLQVQDYESWFHKYG